MTSAYTSQEMRRTATVEAGGAATESMGGLVVVILTILALAGVGAGFLTPIAGIVFGAAFIIEGAAVAARQSNILRQLGDTPAQELELGGGVTVELAAGLAAVVLGVLALVGVVPAVLIAVLVITGGVGVMLATGAVFGLNQLRGSAMGISPEAQAVARGAVASAGAGQVLAGLGAAVLGILALIGVGVPAILSTVGLLVLGAALTLSGTALSGKLLRLFSRV